MNPSQPDNPNITMQIGRIDGRLGALEERVGRHELFVGNKLTTIEQKLDQALSTQMMSASTKSLFRWVVMIVSGASGWFALLWTGRHF